MKQLAYILCSLCPIGLPLAAQTTIIGGAVNNGDFEAGVINPFGPHGGNLSDTVANATDQNHTEGGQYALKIDLTANNGNGRWKGLTSLDDTANGIIAEYTNPDSTVDTEMWIYIPSATTFGTDPNSVASIELSLEYRNANDPVEPDTWKNVDGSFQAFSLKSSPRDVWFRLQKLGDKPPAEATHIRTRAWNLTSPSNTPPETTLVNGKSPFEAGDDTAVPADWVADGWDGVIFIDDIELVTVPPSTLTVAVGGNINNGNFEDINLGPWNPQGGSLQPDPSPMPPEGGVQSLEFDLTANNRFGQWKPIGGDTTTPAKAGDLVEISAYVYIPADTQFGGNTRLGLSVRSDNGNNNGEVGIDNGNNFPTENLADETIFPRDTWVRIKYGPGIVADGANVVSSINNRGSNIETIANLSEAGGPDVAANEATPEDWMTAGYSGNIYIDNFRLTVTTSPEPVNDVLTIVSRTENNGDIEKVDLDPWGGSGVSVSTAQNHTSGGSQSLEIDLTANNGGNEIDLSAKRFLERSLVSSVVEDMDDTDTVDLSAWVYVPADATFGQNGSEQATLCLQVSDGNFNSIITLERDLTDEGEVPRDQWVLIEGNGLTIPPGTLASSLIFTSFQLKTINFLNGMDANDPNLTPADWMTEGYNGSIFIDDINVKVNRAPNGIIVNSTSFGPGGFSLTYLPAEAVVDVYYSTDLDTFNLFEPDVVGGTFNDGDASDVATGFYLVLPDGVTPADLGIGEGGGGGN